MAAPGKGNARKVVLAAMAGNGAIAVSKFVAAWLSGSATMLAEGVHSLADTANQALLLLGMRLSRSESSELYPLGRTKESYFWAFIVSLVLFFLGGVYAIHEGVHKLNHPGEALGSPWVAIVVLVASIGFESFSFYVAVREFNRGRGGRGLRQALFHGKDPTIPLVLLEDAGAVGGLVIALIAVTTSWLTGSAVVDGVGSIVIGVLLCVIGVGLAHDTRSLLIGEGATPEACAEVRRIVESSEGVEAVRQLLTLHLGPDTVLLALKVRFRPGLSVSELESVIDRLETAVRAEQPEMKRIFVEADGDYDAARAAPAATT
ncbi:MAG TPA: cation diffusion facilitator family transporter [Polyangiaceae bacterium]|jgi:cation diffusion facilitator family transporter